MFCYPASDHNFKAEKGPKSSSSNKIGRCVHLERLLWMWCLHVVTVAVDFSDSCVAVVAAVSLTNKLMICFASKLPSGYHPSINDCQESYS